MIITFFSWILIFYIANSYGMIGQSLIQIINGKKLESDSFGLWINIVIGFSVISVILSVVSLFYPISHAVLAALLLISLFNVRRTLKILRLKYHSFAYPYKSKDWLLLLISLVYFVLILIQSVKEPFVTDTGLYHAQTIQWFEKYKVVKGIGNLHGRLAFNSSFHLICALFGFSSIKAATLYNSVQSFLLLFFGFSLLNKIRQEHSSQLRFIYSGILLLIIIFYRDWVSSPSPDIAATIIILTGFIYFLDVMYKGKMKWNDLYILTFICIVAITIKVSSIPIVLLPLIFLIRKWQNSPVTLYKPILFSFLIVTIAIIPWMIRNVIMSGYLVYPLPCIDIFDVFWKVPIEYAVREKQWVHVFARTGSYNLEQYAEMAPFEWFIPWFLKRTLVEKGIFIIVCLSPLIFLLRLVRTKPKFDAMMLTYLASFVGVMFWFIMAPYFRFGHAFIIVVFLMTLVTLFKQYINQLQIFTRIVLVVFIFYSVPKEVQEHSNYWGTILFYPEPYPVVASTSYFVKDKTIYKPNGSILCWDHDIPCTPESLPNLKLIGDQIEDGFCIDKFPMEN